MGCVHFVDARVPHHYHDALALLMPIESDFLIIGSGIAGLSFALRAAEHGTVNVVTKKSDRDSNTNYAQGGIAAVMSAEDSSGLHVQDTLRAGAGICHEDAVRIMVEEGPDRVNELVKWGVNFTRKSDPSKGQFDLAREGGHSTDRVLHAQDMTGREIEQALLKALEDHSNVKIYENHFAVDLLTEHHFMPEFLVDLNDLHCFGAYVLDVELDRVLRFLSRRTLLCTGGVGRVYEHTTNPSVATGDSIAMAYRSGARLANLEFMQFHPTALYIPNSSPFLLSEAMRGFGARLTTIAGQRFMKEYDPQGDLASRDVVARAIDAEMKKSGDKYVFLDLRHLKADAVKERFPNIYARCLEHNLNMNEVPLPVIPAAHYMCGGVMTDVDGRTSIRGLYATGEVACTGVHGANRLASNSLLEAIVFSHRALESILNEVRPAGASVPAIPPWDDTGTLNPEEWVLISHDLREVRSIMWDYVGITRSNLRLARGRRRISLIAEEVEDFYKRSRVSEGLLELRNLVAVAHLVIKCAAMRKESRGLHNTTDYPSRDDENWARDTIIYRDMI